MANFDLYTLELNPAQLARLELIRQKPGYWTRPNKLVIKPTKKEGPDCPYCEAPDCRSNSNNRWQCRNCGKYHRDSRREAIIQEIAEGKRNRAGRLNFNCPSCPYCDAVDAAKTNTTKKGDSVWKCRACNKHYNDSTREKILAKKATPVKRCPYCDSTNHRVYNRYYCKDGSISIQRRCRNCNKGFTRKEKAK